LRNNEYKITENFIVNNDLRVNCLWNLYILMRTGFENYFINSQ